MEQSSEEIDVDLYQAHIELRHLPTPDKEPLQGAYFPQEVVKNSRISTRIATSRRGLPCDIAGCFTGLCDDDHVMLC